jgi:hypothetical protein
MPQFKDIPVAPDARRVRVELPPDQITALIKIGAEGGLTVSAVSRIALSLLARGETVTAARVLEEAERIRAANRVLDPPASQEPKRPVGRPRKTPTVEREEPTSSPVADQPPDNPAVADRPSEGQATATEKGSSKRRRAGKPVSQAEQPPADQGEPKKRTRKKSRK